LTTCAGLAGLALLVLAVSAPAMMIAPQPVLDRVPSADVIAIVKVTGFEDKLVKASPFPGQKNQVEYKIAVADVTDGILGTKGMKKIRLGFIPPPPPPPPPMPGQPVVFRKPFRGVTFAPGQEALVFVTKHHESDFYVPGMYYNVVDKKNTAQFDKDVALAKRCAKLLADPMAGLKAKDAEDRLLTAEMLIIRYRGGQFAPIGQQPKFEPIDGAESKLILETLAAADWTKRDVLTNGSPLMYFQRLGVTAQDGFKPPQNGQDYAGIAQKWVKEHAGSYRIKRVVREAAK
jgi:hypothetical protein